KDGEDGKELECADKFGQEITLPEQEWLHGPRTDLALNVTVALQLPRKGPKAQDPLGFYDYVRLALRDAGFQYAGEILEELKKLALKGQESRRFAIQTVSLLFDRIYDTGYKKRSSLLQLHHEALNEIFSSVPLSNYDLYTRLEWENRPRLAHPGLDSQVLVVDALEFPVEGGDVYVLGNAAGRPLINAVGRPRVVINGTCLDYLAESLMAGDPYNGGGFVIVNGLKPSFDGRFVEQEYPYPGGNLFSLASGGAIFIRD